MKGAGDIESGTTGDGPGPQLRGPGGLARDAADVAETLIQPAHVRRDINEMIRVLDDHGARKVPMPDAVIQALPKVIANLMVDHRPRVQRGAAALALAAMKYNLDLMRFAAEAKKNPVNVSESMIKVYVNMDMEKV